MGLRASSALLIMIDKPSYQLVTPTETALALAGKAKALRLARGWKQSTLAGRSGVSLGSLRRFERTGLISLVSLLKLASALGRLEDFDLPLRAPEASSIQELEARETVASPQRGRQ